MLCDSMVSGPAVWRDNLGGHFGPEKKYLAPPPPTFPNSTETPSRPLRPFPSWRTPLSGIFNKKSTPSPPGGLGLPHPPPRTEKN